MEGSAHYDGRAIDVFVRPINSGNKRTGWAIAQYLVAHAERLDIEHVIFDDRIWTGGAGPRRAGGTTTRPPVRGTPPSSSTATTSMWTWGDTPG